MAAEHLLCFDPGLADNRRQILGRELVGRLEELADVVVVQLRNLVVILTTTRGKGQRLVSRHIDVLHPY